MHIVGGGDLIVWKYVGNVGGGSGGDQPNDSSSIAVDKIFRQSIFDQAKPKQQPKKKKGEVEQTETRAAESKPKMYERMPGFGNLSSGAADVFYNKWEDHGTDGSTFGINPSVTYGDTDELTLTLPLHLVSRDEGDTIFAIGFDGSYKHPLGGKLDKFSAGIHAYGLGFFGGDDNAATFGGGPFVAYSYRINPKWILSAGTLLEFTKPDEGDSVTELVPGLNVGYNLSDNWALNGFFIHYQNLDSDVEDDAYTDIGADVRWVKGSWSLSGGLKTAVGMDEVKSTEIYLGSEWGF